MSEVDTSRFFHVYASGRNESLTLYMQDIEGKISVVIDDGKNSATVASGLEYDQGVEVLEVMMTGFAVLHYELDSELK